MPELVFIDEVSQRTRIPESTLRYYRRVGGGPPSYRLGRRVVYDVAEVDAWVRGRLATSAAPVEQAAHSA